MPEVTLRKTLDRHMGETVAWKRAALGLSALLLTANLAQAARTGSLEVQCRETAAQLAAAEHARDSALEQLKEAALQAEADRQAAACLSAGAYRYIGECVITAYCPCEECCGQWADGLTAAGIPAGPGIVAVDPEVIPLGSTVVIGGQRYLAADTGVKGLAVDVCMEDHGTAAAFGVRKEEVWIELAE